MNDIQAALNCNLPYFGRIAVGVASLPVRYSVLRSLVKWIVNQNPGKPVNILEVGSWIGASALTFARSIQEFNGSKGSITCVDSWKPYLDTTINNEYVHKLMTAASESNISYELFLHNCKASGIEHLIEVKRGDSQTVLRELLGKHFDLIYLDGDHSFEMVLSDIEASKELIVNGGLICGDDLENNTTKSILMCWKKALQKVRMFCRIGYG